MNFVKSVEWKMRHLFYHSNLINCLLAYYLFIIFYWLQNGDMNMININPSQLQKLNQQMAKMMDPQMLHK
uniref:Uncharacterized protein n=1 Tax=Onchocerca volvulus TaxID=6282 RepID=A0A8R1Y2J3_ONCVO